MMQMLVNGVITGLVVALPAIAISLIFGVLRFANFAVGAMLTVSAYATYFLNAHLGLPILIAGIAAALTSAAIAIGLDRIAFRPLRDKSSVTLLVASIGAALVMENAVRFVFGNDVRSFVLEIHRPMRFGDLRINHEQLTSALITVAALIVLHMVLYHMALGRKMRAVADNPDLAAVRGIDREQVLRLTWAICGTLTATAGILIGMDRAIDPMMGWSYVISVFAAAIVGGLGSPGGAVLGAVTIGIVEEYSTLIIPSHYRGAIGFLIIAALLLFRPQGLFGKAAIKR